MEISRFPSPYALPDYLDIIAPGWNKRLINGLYYPEAPRHFGPFRLLEQPLLSQYFALNGPQKPNESDYLALLEQLAKHYHLVDIQLPWAFSKFPTNWQREERLSYRLHIPENMALLQAGFSQHLKRQLKKAGGLKCVENPPLDAFMAFLKAELQQKTCLPTHFYTRARQLLQQSTLHWKRYGIYNEQQQLLAVCALYEPENMSIYQLAAGNEAGKKVGAMPFMLAECLKSRCGSDRIFDFEGSMIPGLQRFYSEFGAKPYIYTRVIYNRLPWPLSRWKHGKRSQ